jgi:phosphoribosylformylglycinamidine synthase
MVEKIVHYYRKTDPPHSLLPTVKEDLKRVGCDEDVDKVEGVETESCFNVRAAGPLTAGHVEKLEWLLSETFDRDGLQLERSCFAAEASGDDLIQLEFGPRLAFTSAFSSNAVSVCQACGVPIERLELSRRYQFKSKGRLSEAAVAAIKALLHDRMTEQEYHEPLQSFDSGARPAPVRTIPIMEEGRAALEKINQEMGLGFDDFDLDYYTTLFKVQLVIVLSSLRSSGWSARLTLHTFTTTLTGEAGTQSDRCRVFRHGPIKLGAFSSLVLWWKDGH